jgi:hypothetical protein
MGSAASPGRQTSAQFVSPAIPLLRSSLVNSAARVIKPKHILDNSRGAVLMTVTSLAVCVQTDDPELLIPRKIYEITLYENDLARVVDEAGEATIYPASFFMVISLPEAVENALAEIA